MIKTEGVNHMIRTDAVFAAAILTSNFQFAFNHLRAMNPDAPTDALNARMDEAIDALED